MFSLRCWLGDAKIPDAGKSFIDHHIPTSHEREADMRARLGAYGAAHLRALLATTGGDKGAS